MSVQLFVAPESLGSTRLRVQGDEHHYLSHVRRLAIGDAVVLLDGQGMRAHATIVGITSDQTQLEVGEAERVVAPDFHLTIAAALIKGDRMDQALSKMVELGVATICPLVTERTIVRLKGKRVVQRQKRFEALAQAASRQSQNPHPTTIVPIESFAAFLKRDHKAQIKLIPDVGLGVVPLTQAIDKVPHAKSALVLIGPEGGFTSAEVDLATRAGFSPISLGDRVMRAETACIAMASILGFRYGDVGRLLPTL